MGILFQLLSFFRRCLKGCLAPLLLASALTACGSGAAEYYRPVSQARPLGIDQGAVGSCQADSEVTALESAFGAHGMAIRLSRFYRHEKIGAMADPGQSQDSRDGDLKINLSAADRELLAKAGSFVPEYMWPEDSSGYDPRSTGTLPSVSEAAIIDPGFPTVESLGFKQEYFTFQAGLANSRGLEDLKAALVRGDAVTLNIHPMLMDRGSRIQWDPRTGMLSRPYRLSDLLASTPEGLRNPTHSVAVVGFDDQLYSGRDYAVPGALLVRNSWNDSEELADASMATPLYGQELADLERFRIRLNRSGNLPGYYAIPYQYIVDMESIAFPGGKGVGGYKVITLDYDAFFAAYEKFGARYRIYRLPYVCDGPSWFGQGWTADAAREKIESFGKYWRTAQDDSVDNATRQDASQRVITYL